MITLTSASIFNGNPIVFSVRPHVLSTTPSFHRVILEIECGINTSPNEIFKMSSPVFSESDEDIPIDISSALRSFRDSYVYSSEPTTYPYVRFRVRAYDEYMIDGEIYKTSSTSYPSDNSYLRTIFGSLPDRVRLTSAPTGAVRHFSLKPASPEILTLGDTYIYASSYPADKTIINSATLAPPSSSQSKITIEGLQTINDRQVFALPASKARTRQTFRFINSLGVLESISVPRNHQKQVAITSDSYILSSERSFNSFSRSLIKKRNNIETWMFTTDPLTEDWLLWYIHDFLMSEHVWIDVHGAFLPCLLISQDTTTLLDRTKHDPLTLQFQVQFAIKGSPLL